MRKTALDGVYKLAQQDERVVFIGSDLGYKTLEEFKNNLPKQFFMEGIAEQNIIGMASGLAMDGHIVYINTIAPFLTRRCYEQVMLDIAMHNLPVRLIGSGGGVVYAPLGSTHLAFDDIALMRAIPNMSIVAPADAEQMNRLLPQTLDWDGPMYIRMAKGYDPVVTPEDEDFQIGKPTVIADGSDILFVTTGITLKYAQETAKELEKDGKSSAILHYHTIKPFDKAMLIDYANKVDIIIVIEEHIKSCGLGEMVGCLLLENNISGIKFKRFSLPDVYPDHYGSQNEILKEYDIDVDAIVNSLKSDI